LVSLVWVSTLLTEKKEKKKEEEEIEKENPAHTQHSAAHCVINDQAKRENEKTLQHQQQQQPWPHSLSHKSTAPGSSIFPPSVEPTVEPGLYFLLDLLFSSILLRNSLHLSVYIIADSISFNRPRHIIINRAVVLHKVFNCLLYYCHHRTDLCPAEYNCAMPIAIHVQ
jgi:hypothetical protein